MAKQQKKPKKVAVKVSMLNKKQKKVKQPVDYNWGGTCGCNGPRCCK